MTPSRTMFLTLSAVVALGIGAFALAFPHALLESKGVLLPNAAALLWVRELGVAIFALGVTMLLVRKHDDSPTLRAFLLGNALIQIGLLPLELFAYQERVITLLSGVVPNSVLHVVLASGFLVFASRMKRSVPEG